MLSFSSHVRWNRSDFLKGLATFFYLGFVLVGSPASAATYYVDYTNGSDSNNGTSKTTAWKYAPGMYSSSGTSASTTLNAGDSVILKGCVTWPNASFPWAPNFNGSPGNPIYYGVDQTWWDATVAGCSSSWNRPILNPGATSFSRAGGLERLVYIGGHSNQTFDNFEVKNVLHDDGPVNNQVSTFDFGDGSNGNNVVQNCYIHGWVNPYFAIGTGDVAAGSSTITNFVPYSYSPQAPTAGWASLGSPVLVQVFGLWPIQSNGPAITSISGSNPYTISTNSATVGSACTGCVIQLGQDFGYIFAGVEGQCSGCIAQNNVIDGSDTLEAQLNPYGDCGAAEGNNQFCATSAIAGWRLPNIWRNNVIRYVASAFVGECTEWSGNLIEYIRLSINPTAHTNGIECLDEAPVNNATLSYNNVIRNTNNPNPNAPGGQWSIGLLNQYTPVSGTTAYVFNNVVYNTLQNSWEGAYPSGNGCCGTLKVFNNTSDGGPTWQDTSSPLQCSAAFAACTFQNNQSITSNSAGVNNCGGNCTQTTNLLQTPALTLSQGYSLLTTFVYAPILGGLTIGAGTSLSSLCSAVGAANAAAGNACGYDTTYGAAYNTSNHTAVTGARTPIARPSNPDIGAYQYSSSVVVTSPPPSSTQPPSGVSVISQ